MSWTLAVDQGPREDFAARLQAAAAAIAPGLKVTDLDRIARAVAATTHAATVLEQAQLGATVSIDVDSLTISIQGGAS